MLRLDVSDDVLVSVLSTSWAKSKCFIITWNANVCNFSFLFTCITVTNMT